jgi:hypothetical protein
MAIIGLSTVIYRLRNWHSCLCHNECLPAKIPHTTVQFSSPIGNKTLTSDRGEHKEKYKLFLFPYWATTRNYSSDVNALPEYFRFSEESLLTCS